MNQLKAGAVLSYLYLGLGTAISIAYTPFMLRLLGQSEYGLYNLVASVVSYLGLLNFGFGHAYIRYFSRFSVNDDRENIAKLNGMFLIIFSIIGLIAVLAGGVLVYYTETILGSELTIRELSIAKVLMVIMVINIAISFPAIVFNSHITAKERFIFQKSLQLVRVIANPLLVLPVLIMGYGSIGMVVVITVLNLAIEISNMFFCFKKLRIQFTFREFDFSLMKEMAVFSSFIFMNLIVNQINWNVDRFILGRFHGTIAVATYSLSSQLNAYYLSLSTAISNVFVPRVNKMVSSENDSSALTSLFTSVGRMQFFVLSMVFTGLIFFGRPFISMWAGADYAESYPIALMLIIPVTIPLIQNLGIEIQRAKNMHKFRSWVYLFIAIGNIFITIPLVKLYGGIGAAAGTAIALIIGNIFIMNWYYHRRVGLNILFFWKRIISILPSTIPPVLLGLFLSSYFDLFELHMLIICGLCYIIVYTISIWVLGLNEYEKSLVIKPLNKLKSKLFSK
jgi:O-antigen/teichoic acid export membrane protein